MNLLWLLPPPQKGVKHPDLRAPQPPARLHLARRPSGNLATGFRPQGVATLGPCLTTLSTLTPEFGVLPAAEPPPSAPPGPRPRPGPQGGGAWRERGPLPRAERSAAQTHHAVLLVPRGVGQGAGGGGRPAVLFVCAGPIGYKEKGPQWAVRGGQTTGAGRGHLCTWARQGPAWTAPALSLEAPCPRLATPRQRGLQPLSWYCSLVIRAPLRPPLPACHSSCSEKALVRGPRGNRSSPRSH